MERWRIKSCVLDDAPALARNNGGAFWSQPMWRIVWPKDMEEEFIIEQPVKCMPLRILKDRRAMRQQKAVDPDSGCLVGYARWELPSGRESQWLEAQGLM